jgi:hypothetical protein
MKREQIGPGQVLMDFSRDDEGKWTVLWHSNTVDYDTVRAIIKRHTEPQPMIGELIEAGFRVAAMVEGEEETKH